MRKFDRRQALKGLGALASLPLLPRCGKEAAPLHTRIDTIVYLTMENRSFDHYFGARRLVEGQSIDGLEASMSNPDSAGTPIFVAPADSFCVADPAHSWSASHRQFNQGSNDGFASLHEERYGAAEAHRAMGYFDRQTLPALYTLADNYALCERWFCSVMSSTWPNRFYGLAAQSKGVRTNDESVTYDFLTIYDRLERAGLSWGVFYGNVSFSGILSRNYSRDHFHELASFFEHAAAGSLPNYCVLEPQYGRNDDHPPAHPLAGQILIASIYEALRKSPQWGRLLFVITYDEHGGFYDHVPPPTVVDDFAAEGFDQLGFRVPSVVVGPYVNAGVSRTVYDHTSVLAFAERLWELRPLTARDANANDPTDTLSTQLLDEATPRPAVALAPIEADESELYAPECRIGLAHGGVTGQPELERFYDAHPHHPLDRRRHTDTDYEVLLRHAEKQGLLSRRTKRR